MKVAYLGPAGTFSDDALREAQRGRPDHYEHLPTKTIPDAIFAVERGQAERALVPIENSLEGSVRPTLDTLASDEVRRVTIIGELDYRVRLHLIARRDRRREEIQAVLSHPQALAQCAVFLRERVPAASSVTVGSTAEAVKMVSKSSDPMAAVGAAVAADLYGCEILEEDIQDRLDNTTRFVWLASQAEPAGGGRWKTSIVFSELGADRPGALLDALAEFADRGINLTRIESRPHRQGLGHYMFFCDLDGGVGDASVAEALDRLRTKVDSLKILGSYPTS